MENLKEEISVKIAELNASLQKASKEGLNVSLKIDDNDLCDSFEIKAKFSVTI